MRPHHQAGIAWPEILVALFILTVLISMAMPSVTICTVKGDKTAALSNARQIYTAMFTMVMDGETSGQTNLAWPGDTGGTFAWWASKLVASDYLKAEDLRKFIRGSAKPKSAWHWPWQTVAPETIPLANTNALLIYAVSSNSPSNAVFITSANFTNTPTGGVAPLSNSVPFGQTGFVVFRKGGDGTVYKPTQVGDTNEIGSYVPLLK